MVKKQQHIGSIIIGVILGFILLFQTTIVHAETFETKAGSAIIVDADTGKVLFGKNEKEALPPASMTKMMTEYIVFEKIDQGELRWEDKINISDLAYEISADNRFSGIGLRQNKQYTVKELYDAMAINSDNATTIALAEHISGSEGKFVELMNQKGEEMGLKDFKFVNSTGLDNDTMNGNHPEGTSAEDTNLLSAEAAALIAYHIVNDYPEALEIASIPEIEFDGQMVRNWNWMLAHETSFLKQFYYEGLDGLKTGNTELAKFTFTSTAKRKDRRLITVVMKAESEAVRFQETAKLLDYGFNHFENVELFPAAYQLPEESTIPVSKGVEDTVEISMLDGFDQVIKKGTEEDYKVKYTIDESLLNEAGELIAPIKKGDLIGYVELIVDERTNYGYILEDLENKKVDLVVMSDIEKKGWFSLLLDGIGNFFSNIWQKITGIF